MFDLEEMERLEQAATPGPWKRCFHLQSPENDANCPCGYRGSVWSGDGEAVVFEMGATPSEHPDLDPPNCKRSLQLADAALIVALRNAAPEIIRELRELRGPRAAPIRSQVTTNGDNDLTPGGILRCQHWQLCVDGRFIADTAAPDLAQLYERIAASFNSGAARALAAEGK